MSSETPNSGGSTKPPIPTPAKKVPAWNIEKRGDRLYEVNSLHKWFAISSLLFFIFTVVVIMADYSREWKVYQRDYTTMSINRAKQDIAKASGALDRNKLKQDLATIQQVQTENAAKIGELEGQLKKLNADFYRIDTDYKNSTANYGSEKYGLDEAVATAKKIQRNNPKPIAPRKFSTSAKWK